MKSCATCRWAPPQSSNHLPRYSDCLRPSGGRIDPVSGVNGNTLHAERNGWVWTGHCGKQGRYWQAREVQP